jgi:hypothetical protein
VFEEFFATGLRMLLQPVLTDILLKFHVQLHELTPNAFAQFSKYFWVVLSFGKKPCGDGFVKHYESHYQPKRWMLMGLRSINSLVAQIFMLGEASG